jgi:hypothetical protein
MGEGGRRGTKRAGSPQRRPIVLVNVLDSVKRDFDDWADKPILPHAAC